MGSGPLHIINNGLIKKLQSAGYIIEYEQINTPDKFATEVPLTFTLLEQIRFGVNTALENHSFPIILSGNCNAVIGTVAAHNEDSIGVVWFDAHGDCETPETTTSGFLDGMALSILTGACWHHMALSLKNFKHVSGKKIVLIGARDLSNYELEFISTNAINHITVDQIHHVRHDAIRLACDQLIKAGVSKFHIHVDVDVFDPSIAPANSYAVNNGLSKEDLIQTVKYLDNYIPIASLTIASYDPLYDEDDRMLATINEMIERIAGL